MHWKLKALLQNVVSRLPGTLSLELYYRMQRQFGALRSVNPLQTVRSALEITEAIRSRGGTIDGKVVLEVGTGRRVVLPMMMWLLGAKQVITVDLNRYLRPELVADDLKFFRSHQGEVLQILEASEFRRDRFGELMRFETLPESVDAILTDCNIKYLSPADAGRLPFCDGSIDFHVSTNVFEHIPPTSLAAILREAARVVNRRGLAVHRIDHSDHFAHADASLSPVNYLRYNEAQWSRLAGNRFMYMNRLHVDDFQRLFSENGHEVLAIVAEPNQDILREVLGCPHALDSQFANKSPVSLATMNSLFVSRSRAVPVVADYEYAA